MRNQIQTYGNKCYIDKNLPVETTPKQCVTCQRVKSITAPTTPKREKPEQVNLKFGKIRVKVTNSKHVQVAQDGTTMILRLEQETPEAPGAE